LVIVRYAAYGSNLHPLRLTERVPTARLLGTAFVEDHELRFNKRSVDASGKCSVEKSGAGVHVAVYDLDTADKVALDVIEGVGQGYHDSVISVPGFSDCAVYIAEEDHKDDNLKPYDWYRELVLLGCWHLEFPKAYIASIAAIDSIPDPDAARREHNEDLIGRIRRSL